MYLFDTQLSGEARERFRRFVPEEQEPARAALKAAVQKAFQSCFMDWTRAVAEATDGEVDAVDSKSARGSRNGRRGKPALHMVSAWGCRNRLVLGQEATVEQSNEITALPKLLELLELKGGIVTLDAMGCQTKIAAPIIRA